MKIKNFFDLFYKKMQGEARYRFGMCGSEPYIMGNAGVQRGVVNIYDGNKYKLFIEAEAIVNKETILHSVPLEKYNDIPISIINFAFKTHEYLVLNNVLRMIVSVMIHMLKEQLKNFETNDDITIMILEKNRATS